MSHWRDYFVQLMEQAVADKPFEKWPEAIEAVRPDRFMRDNRISYRKWLQVKCQFIEDRRKLFELKAAAAKSASKNS